MPSSRAASAPPVRSVGRSGGSSTSTRAQRRDLFEGAQLVGLPVQRRAHARALAGPARDRALQRAVALEQVGGRLLARCRARPGCRRRGRRAARSGRAPARAARRSAGAPRARRRRPRPGRRCAGTAPCSGRHALEHVAVAGQDQRRCRPRPARPARRSRARRRPRVPGPRRSPSRTPRTGRAPASNWRSMSSSIGSAVGVVAREQLDAVVGGVLAEGHHDRARVVGGDLLEHHVDAAEQRVHRPSLGALDRARQRVVRAEQQRRRVDDQQRGSGRPRTPVCMTAGRLDGARDG